VRPDPLLRLVRPLLASPDTVPTFPLPSLREQHRLMSQAAREGLGGILYPALRASNWPITRAPSAWAAWWLDHVAATFSSLAVAERVAALLDARELPWVGLKGPYLGQAYFPRSWLRPCGDLDLLVSAEAFDEARARLEESGALPCGPTRTSPHLASVILAWPGRRPQVLHLHRRALNSSLPGYGRLVNLTSSLLAGRQRRLLATTEVWVPAPEHLLTYLVLHGVKHSFDRLLLAVDLYLVLTAHANHPSVRSAFAKQLEDLGLGQLAALVQELLRTWLDCPLPPGELPPWRSNPWLLAYSALLTSGRRGGHLDLPVRLSLEPTLAAKAALLLGWVAQGAFPPNSTERR